MRKYLLLTIFIFNFLVAFSQQLPNSYPSYVFKFSVTDSTAYQPLYRDFKIRDSLETNFGGNNRHREALAVEKYQLEAQNINFLSRQSKNERHWNLSLTNGEYFELKIPKYSDIAEYAFEHYYKSQELLVFREQWGEGNAYLLLNRRTGQRTRTWGPPVFSPNGKYFVSFNDDLEAQYSPNGLQLFEIIDGQPELQLEYEMDVGPTRATWLNDTTFRLEVYKSDFVQHKGFVKLFEHYIVKIVNSDL